MRASRSLILVLAALALAGCGTKREEIQHQEHRDEVTGKTTTVVERTGTTAEGKPYAETVKTVAFTEQVAKGEASGQITATTTLQAPELALLGRGVAMVAGGVLPVPGLGAGLAAALAWLTGTPDGAAMGIAVGTTLAVGTKKAISDRMAAKRKDDDHRALAKDFDQVVQGTSDFMQAHPEHAPALKAAHAKAQDRTAKERVLASRVRQDLV